MDRVFLIVGVQMFASLIVSEAEAFCQDLG
jgi:hypothetical protein